MTQDLAYSNSYLTQQTQLYIRNASIRRVKSTGKLGISYNTIRCYQLFYKIIEQFEVYHGSKINLEQVEKSELDSFTNWLINIKKYSINNAGQQIKILKTIATEAEKNGLTIKPHLKYISSFSKPSNDRHIHTLSFEEIERIKALTIKDEILENARKWLLIGVSIGQRVSDLLKLKPSQIRPANNGGLYIDIIQKKTTQFVTIGVIDPFVINILKREFPTRLSEPHFNKYIKEVCKLANITETVKGSKYNKDSKRKELSYYPKNELICSHDLRRSFATNYFGKIPTPILMEITGHKKESTFQIYIGANQNKDSIADAFMEQVKKLV
jgi:integrase